ncbi:MAG: hypothetical protein J7M29_04615 [Verrucomicrobia bacterium]|nr:hypothetical protein [Verrucomicrobiota bacterium]
MSYFPEPIRTRFLRAERCFIVISGMALWATACAKLISALLGQPILKLRDPVFSIPNRELLLLVAACEFVGSAYCLFGERRVRKLMVVNFLSAAMLAYRILRKATGFAGYDCPCLGAFQQWLPLDSGALELVLKGLMAFMLAFSSAFCSLESCLSCR